MVVSAEAFGVVTWIVARTLYASALEAVILLKLDEVGGVLDGDIIVSLSLRSVESQRAYAARVGLAISVKGED